MIENVERTKKFFVIDAHCHIYPNKIVDKAVMGTDKFYDVKSACKGTIEDMLNVGGNAHVDHYIVQSVATTPHQVQRINEFIANEVNDCPNLLTGLGTLHPESLDVKGDIERLTELGLHGIKLHPDIQGFDVDDKRCMAIYEICESQGKPLLVHTGDYRYDHSNPNRVKNVLNAFPNLTFVGAHFGGWSIWERATAELHEYKNFYVDCSSSFFGLTKETAKNLIRTYGENKVMFGSDYPMWNAKTELEFLLSLGLTDCELEKILSSNAKKVYKIV